MLSDRVPFVTRGLSILPFVYSHFDTALLPGVSSSHMVSVLEFSFSLMHAFQLLLVTVFLRISPGLLPAQIM